jgi:hypothetical protein
MARDRTVLAFGETFSDGDGIDDLAASQATRAARWVAIRWISRPAMDMDPVIGPRPRL